MLRTKVYRANEMKVLDEATGRVSAIVSSESRDRDGDVIRAEGWNLDNFMRHPVLLASHDYHSLRSQIGEWESMQVDGTTMRGVARFFIGKGNLEADWAFQLAKEKALAFSVGFVPDMEKAAPLQKDDPFGSQGMEFKGQELLEVSAVTVPSNPDALQRVAKAPNLHPAVAEIVEERLAEDEPEPDQRAAGLSDEDLDAIAERVLDRFNQAFELDDDKGGGDRRRREADDDDDPSADDDNADEDDYGDGDEPEARVASTEESEFDPYAVAAAAAEEALSEEES
jgi:phage head maturation protease